MGRFVDLTGQTFGRLTVVERTDDYVSPSGHHLVRWLCKCDCKENRYIIVNGGSLTRKLTKSCGCLHNENSREMGKKNKKYNTYNLTGEYGIGYTLNGKEFWFDLEDYELIKDYCWHIDNGGYVRTNDDKGNCVLLHGLIMGISYIDHVNHKTFDNRKSNLRIVTVAQNNMNASKRTNNTSGTTGISWHKGVGKWRARINVNGKEVHLGYFDKFEDAVKARKEAEDKYFGEYSYDNSMKIGGN